MRRIFETMQCTGYLYGVSACLREFCKSSVIMDSRLVMTAQLKFKTNFGWQSSHKVCGNYPYIKIFNFFVWETTAGL